MSSGAPDLSRVRNAVRDTAESMHRFEMNWARMQREMETASQDGATKDDLDRIATQALRGKPEILKRFAGLIDRIAREVPNA